MTMKRHVKPPRFGGIRHVGDLAADQIGASTLGQQNEAAERISEITDPVQEGLMPQDRIERYDRKQGD